MSNIDYCGQSARRFLNGKFIFEFLVFINREFQKSNFDFFKLLFLVFFNLFFKLIFFKKQVRILDIQE